MSEQPHAGPPPGHNPYHPSPPAPAYSPYQLGPNGIPIGPPPDHPQMTTVLILGILGFSLCQLVSPFAWVMGHRALAEIDASPGRWAGRSNIKVGYILGIVGSCILGLYVLGGLVYAIAVVVAIASSA